VYGDADQLIETRPNDVSTIPFGWDEITENNRIKKLQELNASVSCLPSVQFFYDERWLEVRVEDMNKPWTWETIDNEIEKIKEKIDKQKTT
jgi:hypothetical protein